MLGWWSVAHAASTCFLPPRELAVDPSDPDRSPPSAPELLSVSVDRGRPPGLLGGECAGVGSILVELVPPGGAGTVTTSPYVTPGVIYSSPDDSGLVLTEVSAEPVGYRLSLVDGTLPEGMGPLPEAPLTEVLLSWADGEDRDQDPISFRLELTPVDPAGNAGPPLVVEIADDGTSACDSAAGAPWTGAGALGLAAVLFRRRRPAPARA